LATPIALAGDYQTSMHATIRYYAEHHPDAVSLLIAGRFPRGDVHPIFEAIASPSFRAQFGAGDPTARPGDIASLSMLQDLIRRAAEGDAIEAAEFLALDLRGERRALVAEAFCNQHCVLVLLTGRAARRLGQRVGVRAS
jgi:hypothetical protein